jgi:O-antigen ligase
MHLFDKLKPIVRKNKIILNKIFFILLLFSSLLSRLKIPHTNLSINYLFFSLLALLLFTLNFHGFKKAILDNKKSLALLGVLYIWLWICALFSNFPSTAVKYTAISSIYFVLFIVFLGITYKNKDKLSYFILTFRLITFISALGIIQYFFPSLWLFKVLTYKLDSFYPRISSLMQWPNQFAVVMAIGVSLAIILYKNRGISKFEFYLSLVLFLADISLAVSRNGWLMLFLVICLLWIYRQIKIKETLIIMSIWFFCMLFFPLPTYRLGIQNSKVFPLIDTVMHIGGGEPQITVQNPTVKAAAIASDPSARTTLAKEAIGNIIKRPFTGVGLGVFAEHIHIQSPQSWGGKGVHTHNLFLNILVELGIPGFILFLTFLWNLLKKAKFKKAIISIPVIIIFASQITDYFMLHDSTFTVLVVYFLAQASNSRIEETTRTL